MKKYSLLVVSILLISGFAAAAPGEGPKPGLTPDSPFYFVEQAAEKIEVAIAKAPVIGSKELEAKVRANNAAERLSEAEKLRERNKTEAADMLMEKYSEGMNRSSEVARESKNSEELTGKIENVQRDQLERMKQLREDLPEQSRKGIDRAIENSEKKLGKERKPVTPENAVRKPEKNATSAEKPDIRKPDRTGKDGNLGNQEKTPETNITEEKSLNGTGENAPEETTNRTRESSENSSEPVEETVSDNLKPGEKSSEADSPVTGAAVSGRTP